MSQALVEYYELAKTSIEYHSKSQVLKGSPVLFRFLTKAFELRFLVANGDAGIEVTSDEVDQLEGLVIDVALTLVLKLNDATFRPFFIQLVDWASIGQKKNYAKSMPRAVTLFRFLKALCERLKSLVTKYMSYILELTSDLLQQPSTEDSWSALILSSILGALEKSFEFDQDGKLSTSHLLNNTDHCPEFWQSPSHFSAVAEPLLLQLGRPNGDLITEHVIPTITALASAVTSNEHYKTINAEILKLMRSESTATRLAAVKCERSLTDRLGEDWLVLLPEMLPFITELLEDDNEQVERETRAWIRVVEDVLGESLEGMLQ
jgi:U3 small nucleolar RNA-associated protein 10